MNYTQFTLLETAMSKNVCHFDANDNICVFKRPESVSDYSTAKVVLYMWDALGNRINTRSDNYTIIFDNTIKSVDDYINVNDIAEITVIYCDNNYYVILPQNYCVNTDGYYTFTITLSESTSGSANQSIYGRLLCRTTPLLTFDSYQYQDGELQTPFLNMVTITKTYCKLNFSYSQDEGDNLKYYQFFLYNSENQLIGSSQKIYSSNNITYGVENYNNLQQYKLQLHCETQSGNVNDLYVSITTDYDEDSVYANILFNFDQQTATNNIIIDITQLNGEGEQYSFDDNGEYVVIPHNGYVGFTDQLQLISNNFLCRMWCKNLIIDIPIFTITNMDSSDYIEVYFTGKNFYAYKHSCNLTTIYISDDLSVTPSENDNIYFAFGHYNGRIEMYAQII